MKHLFNYYNPHFYMKIWPFLIKITSILPFTSFPSSNEKESIQNKFVFPFAFCMKELIIFSLLKGTILKESYSNRSEWIDTSWKTVYIVRFFNWFHSILLCSYSTLNSWKLYPKKIGKCSHSFVYYIKEISCNNWDNVVNIGQNLFGYSLFCF